MISDAASSGRLPVLSPGDLTPRQAALYEAIVGGPRAAHAAQSPIVGAAAELLGPFNAMLFNPELGLPMQALGAAIRYETSLADETRELAILVVAALVESPFEWSAHEPLARAAGVDAHTIAELAAGRMRGSERHRIVLSAVEALVRDGDLSDVAFAEIEAEFGIIGCVELVSLVGYYRMLALMLRAFRVPARRPPEQDR